MPKDDKAFHSASSPNKNPSTFEKCRDIEVQFLQLPAIQEIYPTVRKQSPNISFFEPSFIEQRSKLKEYFYLLILHWELKEYCYNKK